MKFTWDSIKVEKVKKDHKIDFEKIKDVFEDTFSIDLIDESHSTRDEERYIIIGKITLYGLINLVYTMPNDNEIRFITARKAEKWQVKKYEENLRRT
jgi:uncharacterized DUF497 family protein